MVPMLVRFRPIEPLLAPVVPVVLAVTVQVADGAPPLATAEVRVGAVPPVLLVTRPKLVVATLLTGSLKVTVQVSGPAFVGFVPARLIELTVGAVESPSSSRIVPVPCAVARIAFVGVVRFRKIVSSGSIVVSPQ